MRSLAAVLLALAAAATAQEQRLPQLEPLPEPPPPARGGPAEPAVRIPAQKGDKVEVLREGGRIVMVRITPPNGKPYYLIDTTGNGNWMRRDSLDDGVRVPMWEIYTFD
jgi:hypothetical protein